MPQQKNSPEPLMLMLMKTNGIKLMLSNFNSDGLMLRLENTDSTKKLIRLLRTLVKCMKKMMNLYLLWKRLTLIDSKEKILFKTMIEFLVKKTITVEVLHTIQTSKS